MRAAPPPRGRPQAPWAVAALVLLAGVGSSRTARAADPSEKEQCIRAAESGQELRDNANYAAAREAFARCERASCPAVIRRDCAQWREGLVQTSTTVTIVAKDPTGREVANVSMQIDGQTAPIPIPVAPTRVDPGPHTFHFEAPGFLPVDQRVVLRPQNRERLDVVLAPIPITAIATAVVRDEKKDAADTSVHATANPALDVGSMPIEPSPTRRAPFPIAAVVFAATAGVAFASEAYFGISGFSDRQRDLASTGCSPHCGAAEADSIQTKFIIADVSLGIGLVSAGLAGYFFLKPRPSEPADDVGVDFSPRTGGGVATVNGRF